MERAVEEQRRYRCKGCGKSFNALTGAKLSGLRHKERWLPWLRKRPSRSRLSAAPYGGGVATPPDLSRQQAPILVAPAGVALQ